MSGWWLQARMEKITTQGYKIYSTWLVSSCHYWSDLSLVTILFRKWGVRRGPCCLTGMARTVFTGFSKFTLHFKFPKLFLLPTRVCRMCLLRISLFLQSCLLIKLKIDKFSYFSTNYPHLSYIIQRILHNKYFRFKLYSRYIC